ncbi:hypothetical protein [Mycolicibacterium sp. 120270]|uniref:hypothetical protein n=1 Tax=Mycolicibacterium sp. 120270 TaxID=3090600 RepID=UPI00299EF4D2|nr:hypothetical protein [Mycolicibacterium sp. 120270]MDX1886852.1 hypothetical protein [Mycolicibacterium sp. 120270]
MFPTIAMFDGWEDSADYPTLFRVCREVSIDTARIFPPSGIRKDELPMFVKSGGLLLEPSMRGRQIAWIRRASLHLSTGQKRSGTALQTQTVSPAPDVSLSATINVDLRHAV